MADIELDEPQDLLTEDRPSSSLSMDSEIGDDESESGDEFDQDPVEMIREFGAHPLMERAQEALHSQLEQTLDRLKSEYSEKEEGLRNITKDKEEVGVEMYGLQQQLARLQMNLENNHEELGGLVDNRAQEEHLLSQVKESYTTFKSSKDEHVKQALKCQSELDAINDTLRQIEDYNEEMESEIAITKRATYKAEDTVQTLEQHKGGQDVLLDRLSSQIVKMEEELTLYESQIQSQKEEAEAAKGVTMDTSDQMELITFEKKQLIQYWKSSLIGLTRRNEAVTKANEALKQAQNKVTDLEMEFEGIKREILEEQNLNETLVGKKDRLDSELRFTLEKIKGVKEERASMAERYDLIKKSIKETDAEELKVDLTTTQLNNEMERVVQNVQVVTREKQQLEQSIIVQLSEESTINKASVNARKKTREVLSNIHEMEIEESHVNNEIARLNMDVLNARMHTTQLQDTLTNLEADLNEKEMLAEKYEMEIRQRHDEIEKKMYRVDRLNKEYEKIVEQATRSGDDELTGPLEATIRHLGREIETMNNQTEDLQSEWLNLQTGLVTTSSKVEEMNDENGELKAKVTVLVQKKNRLNSEWSILEAETKSIEQRCLTLRNDISKLGSLLSDNTEMKNNLDYESSITELQFVDRLKELESETIDTQEKIKDEEDSKSQCCDEIVETERQVLLWEKKLQLEKEMREALDPNIGQSEVKEMEREIHRMKIRLEEVCREEEVILKEIERSIYKREDIAVRYSQRNQAEASKKQRTKRGNKGGSSESSSSLTQNGLRKKVGGLKREVRSTSSEAGEISNAILERKNQIEEVTGMLEEEASSYGEIEENCHKLQIEINDLLYQKQRNKDAITSKQKLLKKVKDSISGSGPIVHGGDGLKVERQLLAARDEFENTKNVIIGLSETFPHLAEVLDRVMKLTDDIPFVN